MNFTLSEEQEVLQETVRSFVENECPPSLVRSVFDGESGHDPSVWKGLVEMGISGLVVPEEFDGAGLELLELALVAEELGRGAVPSPFLGHSLATLALVLGGSDEQKQRWLPALAAGESTGTVALAGNDGSWIPEAAGLRANDGALSGTATWVPGAAGADLIVVACEGGELVVVERSADGVRVEAATAVDRTRRLDTVHFGATPAEPIAAEVSGRLRDAALVLLAADAYGAGLALVAMSASYAQSRQQFGQPIGQFQGLKHQIANMAVEIEPTRGLWWYAAHAFDHIGDESERSAALAKAHIGERAMQVARDSVEAHGGLGFTWECDVQIWFKRVLFDRVFCGAPELHRERIATLGGW